MIIGSYATKHHFPDFREPKDLDTMVSNDYIDEHGLLVRTREGLRVDNFWHESFPEAWDGMDIASPSYLYTTKVSHAFWDWRGNNWNKHMSDILFFQRKGVEFDREVYDILRPIWKAKHGRKVETNLNQSKDAFFKDAVVRKYDHDSLHDSVAYGERPMYESLLKEGSEVLIDSDKFWALPLEEKFKVIREEVYATALERFVVPSDYTCSPRAAYAKSMYKAITSLFKNEWALFIVLNYSELHRPDIDYVSHHRANAHRLILL